MKYPASVFGFLILLWLLFGCGKKGPYPSGELSPQVYRAFSDSLTRLDSLVNAFKVSDNKRSRIYSRHALSLAISMGSQEALARAYIMMGVAFTNQSNDSSYYYYAKAQKIAAKYDLRYLKPQIMYNLGSIFYMASNLKMAVVYFDSSVYFSRMAKAHNVLSNAYNALGDLKSDLLDSSGTKAMYDSAYNTALRYDLPRQTGIALSSQSGLKNDPAESMAMRKEAIKILKKQPGNEEEIAKIQINMGTRSTDPDTAIAYYRAAIELARSGHYEEPEIAAYNNLAYSLMDKNNLDSAEACLVKHAIPIAEKGKFFEWLSTAYDSYKDVLVAKKDLGKALEYEQKALKARIKADRKAAAAQVRLLAALLDARNREVKIQENEKELRQKQYRIRVIIFWFSLSLMILLTSIFIVFWRMQRNKIRYQKSLIDSSGRLIAMEEKMKGQVALELHDLVSPFYLAMIQKIEKARIKDPGIAGELKADVSRMTRNIREISHRMNNDFIGQLTIPELVQGLCEDLKEMTAAPLRCTIGPGDFSFSREETIHVYRITQELLMNAIKHVTYGDIRISLSEEEEMLVILYQDTGEGFEAEAVAGKGLGIMNIFERAKIINGKAVLNTYPGKGTRWYITIPHSRAN